MALSLGIDVSTQGIKAELIDSGDAARRFAGVSVNFGTDLPRHGAPEGFRPDPDPLLRQADPGMWLDALDLLFARMRDAGLPLGEVAAVSGSGQQHGSVYLTGRFGAALESLDPAGTLAEQLVPALSRRYAPIWMDRSTSRECRELDGRFGERLRRVTGSPAVERFTGPQIRKFAREAPEAYRDTAVIHLVSSFCCSVLCGRSAPVDYGDGAGMNLLNLETLAWEPEIAEFTAPGLLRKLPPAVAPDTVAGGLSLYFEKYGLKAGTPVAVWSGDNPNSLIGVGAWEPGTAVVSLGTSDTFFAAMREFRTDPAGCGHVFGNPAGGFMSLICFTNGSLAREEVRRSCGASYEEFDRVTPIPHGERLMLPYFAPESTPLVLTPGVKYGFDPETADNAGRIRALLESQVLSMRLHSAWQAQAFRRIRVTGGASKSPLLRRIIADVFQSEVETISVSNSAGLGAALRAANAVDGTSFGRLCRDFCKPAETVKPDPAAKARYDRMLAAYRGLEAGQGMWRRELR
ncbi:MAG: carbohydrate kinase [Lentisphaeria bacterium]|nr:carbohydrate kinase [Lentisphaeria bacterium]